MFNQNKTALSQIQHRNGKANKIRNYFWLLIIGLAWVLPPSADAQINGPENGDRVKLSAPTVSQRAIIGTVVGVSPSVIVLAAKDSTFYIPHSSVKQLAISKGKKRNIGRSLLIGAVTGGVTLGLIFVASNSTSSCEGNCSRFEFNFSNSEALGIGATFGVLTGGVIGTIIGTRRTDQWKQIPLKVSMGLVPSHPEKLGVNPMVSLRIPLSKRR